MRRPNNLPNVDGRAIRNTIGGVTIGTLAVLAIKAGSHDAATRYDAATEAALQHAIRPAMTKIAKKATGLLVERQGTEDPRTGLRVNRGYEDHPGNIRVVLTNNRYAIHRRLDVVMGTRPGSQEPDPQKVEYVQTQVSYRDPNGAAHVSGTYLSAPYGEERYGRFVSSDAHPDGWSAGMDAISPGDNINDDYVFDSSDSSLFTVDGPDFTEGTAVGTAKDAARDALRDYRDILHPNL